MPELTEAEREAIELEEEIEAQEAAEEEELGYEVDNPDEYEEDIHKLN